MLFVYDQQATAILMTQAFPNPCVSCGRQRARDLSLTGFAEETNVGRYVARRDAKLAEYEPDVPECERIALLNAANCNALPLEEATAECGLPPECDSAGVRYYCEIGVRPDVVLALVPHPLARLSGTGAAVTRA